MFQFTQFPLLQALGYAIINSLWQFAFLWLLYMLVINFVKFTSHQRYVTALSLQFIGFIWFVGTAFFYYGESSENAVAGFDFAPYAYLADSGSSLSFKEMFFSLLLRAELLLPYLSLAYLILISCFTVKILKAYRNTQVLRHEGLQKIDVHWRLFVTQISEQLGVKQSVRIYISNLVESPVTIGHLKPMILLPLAVVNNLSTKQIEAILIHEMAHIKRYDYVFNILMSIIEVALFFNPFMQHLSKHMKRERENSCDDWVLQYEYNACSYAKALLQIASYKTNNAANFAVNAVDNKRALLIRVKRMIEKKDLYQTYRQQIASLVFITIMISSLAWFAPKKYSQTRKIYPTLQANQQAESLMAQVDNPLFNPMFFLANEENESTINVLAPGEPSAVINETAKKEVASVPAEVEKDIAVQPGKPEISPIEKTGYSPFHTIQNVNLDSSLFKNFATRSIVAAEIKKLKKEFEQLNNSSLFENVDWNKFWDNTKVQKQLEVAFEQLKALELLEKNRTTIYTAGAFKNVVIHNTETPKPEGSQLKLVASKKLASIVKDRIKDIKLEQSAVQVAEAPNFHFDLPDFTQLNTKKDVEAWSYSYSEKPRVALTEGVSKVHENSCKELQEKSKAKAVEMYRATVPGQGQGGLLERLQSTTTPAKKTLKIVRI